MMARTRIFLSSILLITLAAVCLVSSTLIVTAESFWISMAWIAGFGFLFLNVAFLFVMSVIRLFLKFPVLQEVYVKQFPKIALAYPIRNETHGLFERIHYSISGNKLPRTDLWILSDSSEEFEARERDLVAKLEQHHDGHVFYRRRELPVERKQGNMAQFVHAHPEYTYVYVCDADGMVPPGTLLKLLRKAEHPRNRDIAIFQASIRIAHAATWYARFEKIGTQFAQRFNFMAYQAIFGRTISFGHHHLARTKALSEIKLPKGLLSHDNWDTALLDRMGYRVAFCADVHAFDESPSSYLEARARSRRWAQGTLQGMPLLFMPAITPASRFLAFYGIYLYIADLVFFCWVILGVLAHSNVTGELMHFQVDSIWLGLFTNHILKWTLIFSVCVIFFHKLPILKSLTEVREYIYELLVSTLITLNNFFYAPLDILSIPLRQVSWIPMAKDPFMKACI
ncbi:glycosyltransferase, partial [Omnitrophica bacterium]|nr:glycosyltransferase [Candidatus Omnitrophota bacterium]